METADEPEKHFPKRSTTATLKSFFVRPQGRRQKNIVRIHGYVVLAVTIVLLIGEFRPATLFEPWNFSDSFPGDAPMFFGTYILVSVTLFPLRPLMLKWFGKAKEKGLKDSGLLDD